jgi:hypothetical protein
MNPFRLMPVRFATVLLGLASIFPVYCEEKVAPASARELASRLSALRNNGSSYVRLRMEIKGATSETFQLQVKQRLTSAATEVVYQVLWPKERKGESVLIRKIGNRPASGSVFVPPSTVRTIGDLKEPLLDSDLSCEDIIENFFAWEHQSIVGAEAVEGVNCQILESKPGKGDPATYARVRSWIDTERMVPLRIEKYSSSGQVLRRIDTTRVVPDAGGHIPANLAVRGPRPGSSTELDGSRIRHNVDYTDAEFTVDGLKQLVVPRGSAE